MPNIVDSGQYPQNCHSGQDRMKGGLDSESIEHAMRAKFVGKPFVFRDSLLVTGGGSEWTRGGM